MKKEHKEEKPKANEFENKSKRENLIQTNLIDANQFQMKNLSKEHFLVANLKTSPIQNHESANIPLKIIKTFHKSNDPALGMITIPNDNAMIGRVQNIPNPFFVLIVFHLMFKSLTFQFFLTLKSIVKTSLIQLKTSILLEIIHQQLLILIQ